MKPASRFAPVLAVAASFVLPILAQAHPGHDHTDIPSVIRHPFVSWDHMAITAAVTLAVGAALIAVSRVRVSKVWAGAGAGLVAAGLLLALR